MCGHMLRQLRIVQTVDFDALGDLVPVGTVHDLQPITQDIVASDKVAPLSDRPRGWRHVNGEIFLYFVNNLEDIATFSVHFVAKCQDR